MWNQKTLAVGVLLFLGGVATGFVVDRARDYGKARWTQKSVDASCYFQAAEPTGERLFRLGGEIVSVTDLHPEWQRRYFEAKLENYNRLANFADEAAAYLTVARATATGPQASLSAAQVPPPEVVFQGELPTEERVKETYERWKASGQLSQGVSLDEARPRIVRTFLDAGMNARLNLEKTRNKETGRVVTLVEPPCSPKLPIDVSRHPTLVDGQATQGAEGGVVIWMDYSCFACRTQLEDFTQAVSKRAPGTPIRLKIVASENEEVAQFVSGAALCTFRRDAAAFRAFHTNLLGLSQAVFTGSLREKAMVEAKESALRAAGASVEDLACARTAETRKELVDGHASAPPGLAPSTTLSATLNGRILVTRPGVPFASLLGDIYGQGRVE